MDKSPSQDRCFAGNVVHCRLAELGVDGKTSACIEQYLNNVEKMKFRRSRVLVLFIITES